MSSVVPMAPTSTGTLWDAAERLRIVRRAHERFLALWAVDKLLDVPAAARVWADIDGLFEDVSDPSVTPDNHAIPDGLQRRFFRGGSMDD